MDVRELSCLLREMLGLREATDEELLALSDKKLTQREVWDVLSALRGPDEKDAFMAKHATTAVLRYALLGSMPVDMDAWEDSEKWAEYRHQHAAETYNVHFWEHVRRAFVALGLKWGESNGPR